MLVIGVIGEKASGKDTIASYIAQKYNGKHHSHSEILGDCLDVLGLEHSRANEMPLVAFRKIFGANVLVNALNKKISNEKVQLQVITGIRFQSELDNIRSYPNNKLIYISAPLEVRFARQKQRTQKTDDQAMTFQRFKEIENFETESQIQELGKQADFKVNNDGDQAKLDAAVDDIMKQVQIP